MVAGLVRSPSVNVMTGIVKSLSMVHRYVKVSSHSQEYKLPILPVDVCACMFVVQLQTIQHSNIRCILGCGLTNISIGQEVLITTSSTRRSANCLASKVYTTIHEYISRMTQQKFSIVIG